MKNTIIALASDVVLISDCHPEVLKYLNDKLHDAGHDNFLLIGFGGEIDFRDLRDSPVELLEGYRDTLSKLIEAKMAARNN